MAVYFTPGERSCLLSLWRQYQRPSYDDHCRREEEWLAKNSASLASAVAKLNMDAALEPASEAPVTKLLDEAVQKARDDEAEKHRQRLLEAVKDKVTAEERTKGAESRVAAVQKQLAAAEEKIRTLESAAREQREAAKQPKPAKE